MTKITVWKEKEIFDVILKHIVIFRCFVSERFYKSICKRGTKIMVYSRKTFWNIQLWKFNKILIKHVKTRMPFFFGPCVILGWTCVKCFQPCSWPYYIGILPLSLGLMMFVKFILHLSPKSILSISMSVILFYKNEKI